MCVLDIEEGIYLFQGSNPKRSDRQAGDLYRPVSTIHEWLI